MIDADQLPEELGGTATGVFRDLVPLSPDQKAAAKARVAEMKASGTAAWTGKHSVTDDDDDVEDDEASSSAGGGGAAADGEGRAAEDGAAEEEPSLMSRVTMGWL